MSCKNACLRHFCKASDSDNLSLLLDTLNLSSCLIHTEYKDWECPVRIASLDILPKLQILIVLSALPDTMNLPSEIILMESPNLCGLPIFLVETE